VAGGVGVAAVVGSGAGAGGGVGSTVVVAAGSVGSGCGVQQAAIAPKLVATIKTWAGYDFDMVRAAGGRAVRM